MKCLLNCVISALSSLEMSVHRARSEKCGNVDTLIREFLTALPMLPGLTPRAKRSFSREARAEVWKPFYAQQQLKNLTSSFHGFVLPP